MENAILKQLTLPAGRRVIAISDIHGNLDYLRALLSNICFSEHDILMIVGDLLEKGPRNLETLRFIMKLRETHTVYMVQGNWDVDPLFRFLPDEIVLRILRYWPGRCTLSDMAAKLGLALQTERDIKPLQQRAAEEFSAELSFLQTLPTIIETQRHIFVHGGIPRETDLDRLDRWSCMKNDDFFNQGYSFQKWVVTGHWPTTLYRKKIFCSDPLVEQNRHIIAIDGGCVLKEDGQLNALILADGNTERVSWERYDHFPVAVARTPQTESAEYFSFKYGDNLVEVLERQGSFTLCRHKSTGRVLPILTAHLWKPEADETLCSDTTDYRLPVAEGDRLSVMADTERGYLVKKEGITGWYQGQIAWES